MVYRFRSFTVIGCCFAFSLWWFGATNFSIEHFYPKEDFCQDVSKIYSDLGHHAFSKRNDLKTAITSYQTALSIQPNNFEAHARLCQCYEQLGEKDNAVKVFLKAKQLNPDYIKRNRFFRKFELSLNK